MVLAYRGFQQRTGHTIATGPPTHGHLSECTTICHSWKRVLLKLSRAVAIYAVAFSPDGKLLATDSSIDMVNVWDAATGKDMQSFRGPWLDFSPDGKQLLSVYGFSGSQDFQKNSVRFLGTRSLSFRSRGEDRKAKGFQMVRVSV